MSIGDKTRKALWARSGNRCALCRRLLVMNVEGEANLSVVGDECHIVAQERGGPRAVHEIPGGDADGQGNVILLCKIHHKCVDDHPDLYPVPRLVELKNNHEKWVEQSLAGKNSPASTALLARMTTGKDLLNSIIGSSMYEHDHDDLQTENEVELVGSFLQNAHDLGEIGEDLHGAARVRAAFSITQELAELNENGFLVFGGTRLAKYSLKQGGDPIQMTVSMVRVIRRSNPEFIIVPRNEKPTP